MLPPPAPAAQAYQISDQSERSTEPITSTLVSSKSSLSEASSSESDSDSDDDDSDATTDSETTERLRDLFLKAKASAREKAASAGAATADSKGRKPSAGAGDSLAGQDEVVFFGGEDSDYEDADERGYVCLSSANRRTR